MRMRIRGAYLQGTSEHWRFSQALPLPVGLLLRSSLGMLQSLEVPR